MGKRIYLLNGPNLNLLGQRQPEIYGRDTLDDIAETCKKVAVAQGMTLKAFQSNSEGQLIDWVHEARQNADAIIINPGAYSHTSIALLDALNTFEGKVIEVHISNIHKREEFRHHSYISLRADGIIVGVGTQGYMLAVQALQNML
ncbi:MAG: type II 3-dehydroquinate dehydratase [Paracoccaceae bacterium]|jgi:3-dehydroquinate dehydratase-2|nr:type II 3-dehydroquinate dehydratase [Paracoccaceae bacterium]NCW53490.1 type II 3-dehydroquinate dehydratase [Paracoccaceae bacterium]